MYYLPSARVGAFAAVLLLAFAVMLLLPRSTLAAEPDGCDSHTHGDVTMDCANALNVYGTGKNAFARGAAVTEASPTNDELFVLSTGQEVCKSGTPVELWHKERTKEDARSVSARGGPSGLNTGCLPRAEIWHWSDHDADGAHSHWGARQKRHPNRIRG